MDNILVLSAAAATYIKIIIDLLRLQWPNMTGWVPPVIAIIGSICIIILMQVGNDVQLTDPVLSQCILAGFLAGGSAITATNLQKSVQTKREQKRPTISKQVDKPKSPKQRAQRTTAKHD